MKEQSSVKLSSLQFTDIALSGEQNGGTRLPSMSFQYCEKYVAKEKKSIRHCFVNLVNSGR